MGDGFVVLQSSDIDIYYYQDEPGVYFHQSVLHFSSLVAFCALMMSVEYHVEHQQMCKEYHYSSRHRFFETLEGALANKVKCTQWPLNFLCVMYSMGQL